MKKTTKLLVTMLAGMMLMAGSVSAAPISNNINVTVNNIAPIEETGELGRVSWEQGVVEAIGTGLPPENARSVAQANVLARRAAIVDAQRNLVESIQGVQVDSETIMKNLQISSDVVTTKVSGLIKGAKIIRQQVMPDGSYQVVMTLNLYGSDGLASVAMDAIKPEQTQQFPTPSSIVPQNKGAIYTGVIIDARGLDVRSTFSPRVYDDANTVVYGNKFIDPKFAISQGMVEYSRNQEMFEAAQRGQSRAGSRPLIIKALRAEDNNFNVVISTADANAMLAYNQSVGFLNNCAVVFAL